MSPERQAAAVEMLHTLRGDIQQDATDQVGQPFSGMTVGTALGQLRAQVDALAHVLLVMLGDKP